MLIELSEQQQHALDAVDTIDTHSIYLVDPRTKFTYILMNLQEYQQMVEELADQRYQRAIHRTALRNALGRMMEPI